MSGSNLVLGPENPAVLSQQAGAILNSKNWEFYTAYGVGGALCGLMTVFLILVSIWRPILVNRVSLRLIFAIIVYDFIVCVIQGVATSSGASAKCRASMFFSSLFGYASVYTSTSIAVNLYMTLLRGARREYLPGYVEYLYYAIPLLVATCQWAPPTIWAAANGYCSAFEPIQTGTTAYILYVVFLQLFLPLCALLFNICISLRVIYMLVSEQRNVSKSLREIMQQTHDRLFSNTPDELDSLNSSGRKNSIMSDPVRKRLELNLLVMQKFNSAAIRIALYPLAPVAWWVINSIYYGVQYSITMTYQSDVDRWVRLVSLAWFSMPAIAIANFIVFVTDPAFVKVVKSVHGQLSSMFWSYINRWERRSAKGSKYEECIHASSAKNRHFSGATLAVDDTATMFGTDDHDTLSGATAMPVRCKYRDELPFELSASGSADNNLGAIERNIDSASDECSSSMSDAPAPLVGSELRDGQMSQTSAAISTYGDMIRRHPTTGSGTHANRFYSKI